MNIVSKFVGCASFLPSKILTNNDLSNIVETSDEWIVQRTGISQRHIAAENESSVDMAIKVAKILLQKHNINPQDIDLIITSTTTPISAFPSVACLVQNAICANNAMCFTIQEACSGFVYGLTIADKFIKSGSHKMALIIGSDKMSSIVDWTDRNTCVLFGDGAGAALIIAENGKENDGIIDSICFSDGSLKDILSTTTDKNKITMNGKEVFKCAVTNMTNMIKKILERNNLSINDIKMVVPHQANARILSSVAKNIGCGEEKFASTVKIHGNTSSASIPLALCEMIKQNNIKTGDLIIMESVGAGMTWGAILMKI